MCDKEVFWSCSREEFLRFMGSICTKRERVSFEKTIGKHDFSEKGL